MTWNDVHSSFLRSRAFGLVYICGLWKPATCLGTCTLPIHVIGGLLWRTSTCPIKSKAWRAPSSKLWNTVRNSCACPLMLHSKSAWLCRDKQTIEHRPKPEMRLALMMSILWEGCWLSGGVPVAVLGMVPVPSEESPKIKESLRNLFSNQALFQVRYLATDNPSPKLFRELKEICPNLSCLSLDPVHLAIVYEYAQWGKKTAGSKVLRCLLHKMNQVAPNMRSSSWGPLFTGTAPPSLTRDEERARHLITDGSMGATRAKRILDNLHPDSPLFCRITFIEALAALCATYPHEVSRKVTGSNKEIRKVLWAATAPDRLEWLMNNLRVRHDLTPLERGLLPSGTSSNESLHAEINSWTKSIRSLHQSTLRQKLEIMQFGKVLAHHVASCFPTVQQTSEAVLLARAVATDVWTDATWQNCCSSAKAPVPLHRARQAEARKVQKWKQTIPMKRRGKRTVHSVKRVHSIRSSGVKPKRLRR